MTCSPPPTRTLSNSRWGRGGRSKTLQWENRFCTFPPPSCPSLGCGLGSCQGPRGHLGPDFPRRVSPHSPRASLSGEKGRAWGEGRGEADGGSKSGSVTQRLTCSSWPGEREAPGNSGECGRPGALPSAPALLSILSLPDCWGNQASAPFPSPSSSSSQRQTPGRGGQQRRVASGSSN